MAIKVRRGNKVDFDQNKLLGGELALVLDEGELYFCYGAGNTKRLQTRDDLTELMELHPDAIQALYDLAQDGTLTTVLNDVANMQAIVSDIEANYNTMYAEKETALDGLYTTKNNSLSGLEADYGNKADILETTYAPRLTGLENSKIGTNLAIKTNQYYQAVNFFMGRAYLSPTGMPSLKEGDTVTLSAYLSNITVTGGVALEVAFGDSNDAEIGVITGDFVTTEGLYSFTFTIPQGAVGGDISARLQTTDSLDNGASIRNLKLELGSLATPWKPSIYRLPALEYEFNAHLADYANTVERKSFTITPATGLARTGNWSGSINDIGFLHINIAKMDGGNFSASTSLLLGSLPHTPNGDFGGVEAVYFNQYGEVLSIEGGLILWNGNVNVYNVPPNTRNIIITAVYLIKIS